MPRKILKISIPSLSLPVISSLIVGRLQIYEKEFSERALTEVKKNQGLLDTPVNIKIKIFAAVLSALTNLREISVG